MTLTSRNKRKLLKILFYACVIALPVLQFVVFYLMVNFNSILLAFQEYDFFGNSAYVGFENFESVFKKLFMDEAFKTIAKNSAVAYVCNLFVGLPLSIIFSYYIFKKCLFSATFRTILFIPQIVSSLVLITAYKIFLDYGMPALAEGLFSADLEPIYSNYDARFASVLFFSVWAGFGTQILMYSSAMANVNESIIEAAEIDGIGYFQELWYIVIPMCFSTISTFLIVGVAGFFTNSMGLFGFEGAYVDMEFQTFGYYLYQGIQQNTSNPVAWPELSAFGVVFTLIVAPVTFGVKYLLGKFGPSVD
ncbi:MAG: sugar ABC transporter permease [Clostridia bacterium]|nr:sugar ABC transporter permease [Clostridia bacterium]